jgi:uncharacterized membrane protein YfcA
MLTFNLQRVRERAVTADIIGYEVEDLQGTIGEVDEASEKLVPSFISVDAMQSPLEKRVILPAAVIERVDHEERRVYVDRRHEEIRKAPRSPNDETDSDGAYLGELRRYYGPGGEGYRDPRDAWTEAFLRSFGGERIDAAALRERRKSVRERMVLPEHGLRDLLLAAGIYAGGFLVLILLVRGLSSGGGVDASVWDVVAVVLLAFVFENLDSSAGMGFGTALSPLLLILGFDPLVVVPGLLACEAATGVTAGVMHNEFRNIEISLRPLNKAGQTLLIIAGIGSLAAIVAEVLTYYVLELPEIFVKSYVGIVILVMAVLLVTNATRGNGRPYRPRRLLAFGAFAGVNKGVGAGGYGPVVTLGGVLSGVFEKTSVAIATLAEGIASTVGTIAFLVLVALGTSASWDLLPWLWLGAFPAAVIAPYFVHVVPSRVWRYAVPVYAVVIATILFVNILT